MKRYSKKWMGTFLKTPLGENNKIVEEMSKKAFEIESVEEVGEGEKKDSLFEIKVLPNRVADAMSLEGMAREMSAVFDIPMNDWRPKIDLSKYVLNNDFVKVGDGVNRFSGFKVTIDKQVETPEWIKSVIESAGGRSINSLVDITNLILFSIGQPTHVFDFEKLNGKLQTRFAKDGEEIELLGDKKVKLKSTDLVIADEKNALSIAGIKGGKSAEVDENTKVVIFEIGNFNSAMIRKTSTSLGLRTDASKIFENGVSTEKTREAIEVLIATILDVYKEAKIEFYFDVLLEEKVAKKVVVNTNNIRSYAGVNITNEEIKNILVKQNFIARKPDVRENIFEVTPPHERLDIEIEEDVMEEVLRIYGFDNIPSIPLNFKKNISHDTTFLVESIIKKYLVENFYTEIINYTFKDKGDIKVKVGIASDKEYLRKSLIEDLETVFTKNYNFMPLLEIDILKFFEISTVFSTSPSLSLERRGTEQEEKRVLLVCDDNKKKTKYSGDLEKIISDLEALLKVKIKVISQNEKPSAVEFSLKQIVEEVEKNNIKLDFVPIEKDLQSIKYSPISIYPFISRDVACWVGADFDFESFKQKILDLKLENFVKTYMFDIFEKEGRMSIAFRIIFQSKEKTLTDVEVEVEMQKVYTLLKENNFEIR